MARLFSYAKRPTRNYFIPSVTFPTRKNLIASFVHVKIPSLLWCVVAVLRQTALYHGFLSELSYHRRVFHPCVNQAQIWFIREIWRYRNVFILNQTIGISILILGILYHKTLRQYALVFVILRGLKEAHFLITGTHDCLVQVETLISSKSFLLHVSKSLLNLLESHGLITIWNAFILPIDLWNSTLLLFSQLLSVAVALSQVFNISRCLIY